MKKSKLFTFFALAALVFAFSMNAFAETKEENLFYNDSEQSMIVWIQYETNDVTIRLIDPAGNTLDPTQEEGGCNTFVSDSGMLIVIPDAMEGQWVISYDKGSNQVLEVSVEPYEDPLWITEFTLDGVASDELQVTFQADYEGTLTYQYILYLTTDNMGGAGRELASGRAAANEEVQLPVSLASVNTYEEYYLRLYVSYTKDGLEYFDDAYTDAFSYTNPEAVEAISDVNVSVDYSTGMVTYDWGDYISWDVQGAYLNVEADGTALESFYVDRDSATKASVSVGDETAEVTAYISVLYSTGRISENLVKTVALQKSGDEFYLAFPEEGTFNTFSLSYKYYNAADQEVILSVNAAEETILLNGSGSSALALEEGHNELVYTYHDGENVTYHDVIDILIDTLPPALSLFESYDGSYTENDSIILVGQTDTDAVLTIQGEAVEVSETGTFSKEVPLETGINEISIKASDGAGNIVNQTIVVNRQTGSTLFGEVQTDSTALNVFLSWLPMLLSLAASVVLIIFLLLCLSVKKKKRGFGKNLRLFSLYFTILSFCGAAASFVFWVLRFRYESTKDFIEYAYYYDADAYAYMVMTRRILLLALICMVVFIIMLLVTILTTMAMKKRAEQPPKPEKAAKQAKAAKAVKAAKPAGKRITGAQQTVQNGAQRTAQTGAGQTSQARAQRTAQNGAGQTSQTAEEYKFCPNCGTKLKADAVFCGSCGSRLDQQDL